MEADKSAAGPSRRSEAGGRSTVMGEPGPLYSNVHENAVVALVRMSNYEELVLRSNPRVLAQPLHKFHLLVDDLVEKHGLYKVDSRGGEITVSGNVSSPLEDPCQSALNFAFEALKTLNSVRVPNSEEFRVKVALASGSVLSAVLGRSGLRYGIHGEPDTLARLLADAGGENRLVASKKFGKQLQCSSQWMDGGVLPSPAGSREEVPYLVHVAYADEEFLLRNSDRNAVRRPTISPWTLTFNNTRLEKSYRSFQADKSLYFDAMYLSLALLMIQTVVVRTSNHGFFINWKSTLAFVSVLICMATTLLPIITILFSKAFYKRNRQALLFIFRISRSVGFLIHNLLVPQVMLTGMETPVLPRILVSSGPVMHAMHAIGAQMPLPYHAILQMVALISVWGCNWVMCQNAGKIRMQECSSRIAMFGAWVSQLAAVAIIPTIIVYYIEFIRRKEFIGLHVFSKKWD